MALDLAVPEEWLQQAGGFEFCVGDVAAALLSAFHASEACLRDSVEEFLDGLP